tara:strand:+ start:3314 stop:4012 length:699 start_codon:yes stop_codon:yes gene_type:complete
MSAIDIAFELLKAQPRFAYHGGHVPAGEPLKPSEMGDNQHALISTMPHNEILGREHGVFGIPIGSSKLPVSQLRDFTGMTRGGIGHNIIDLKPYVDETTAGNMKVADGMGNFYQSLEEANPDFETPYSDEWMQELKDIIARKYEDFNVPLSDWQGKLIGENQITDNGNDPYNSIHLQTPDYNELTLEIPADMPEMNHETITHRQIDPEDVLPMRGNSMRNIKQWMAERMRDS